MCWLSWGEELVRSPHFWCVCMPPLKGFDEFWLRWRALVAFNSTWVCECWGDLGKMLGEQLGCGMKSSSSISRAHCCILMGKLRLEERLCCSCCYKQSPAVVLGLSPPPAWALYPLISPQTTSPPSQTAPCMTLAVARAAKWITLILKKKKKAIWCCAGWSPPSITPTPHRCWVMG